jgi:hypothetical protein
MYGFPTADDVVIPQRAAFVLRDRVEDEIKSSDDKI